MAFTRLYNSMTADADEVHNNFVFIRAGSLLPLAEPTSGVLTPTTSVYDLGSSAYKYKDGFFSGSITAEELTVNKIKGRANNSGYIRMQDACYANTHTSFYYPPCRLDIAGELYINTSGQTITYNTITSWLSGKTATSAATIIYVYAIATGSSFVIKLDDNRSGDNKEPVEIFDTNTSGWYHPDSTAYRCIMAIRTGSGTAQPEEFYYSKGDLCYTFSGNYSSKTIAVGVNASLTMTAAAGGDVPVFSKTAQIKASKQSGGFGNLWFANPLGGVNYQGPVVRWGWTGSTSQIETKRIPIHKNLISVLSSVTSACNIVAIGYSIDI